MSIELSESPRASYRPALLDFIDLSLNSAVQRIRQCSIVESNKRTLHLLKFGHRLADCWRIVPAVLCLCIITPARKVDKSAKRLSNTASSFGTANSWIASKGVFWPRFSGKILAISVITALAVCQNKLLVFAAIKARRHSWHQVLLIIWANVTITMQQSETTQDHYDKHKRQ